MRTAWLLRSAGLAEVAEAGAAAAAAAAGALMCVCFARARGLSACGRVAAAAPARRINESMASATNNRQHWQQTKQASEADAPRLALQLARGHSGRSLHEKK